MRSAAALVAVRGAVSGLAASRSDANAKPDDRPRRLRRCPLRLGAAAAVPYCGSLVDLSGEHVFSDWLNRVLPADSSRRVVETYRDSAGNRAARQYRQRLLKKVVRVVCEPCNSGWMSRIDAGAKAVLVGPIDGQAATFDRAAQQAAAAWAVKTAMNYELSRIGQAPRIPQTLRSELRRHRMPPSGSTVWIAQADSFRDVHADQLVYQRTGAAVAQYTFFVFGRVALLVRLWLAEPVRRPWSDRRWRQIWPRRTLALNWPPPGFIDDETLDAIGDLLA